MSSGSVAPPQAASGDTMVSGMPVEGYDAVVSVSDGSDDVIDQMTDGYYEMDRDFRYRRVNAAGARLSHKTTSELLGKHVLEVFPEVETSEVHRAVVRVMQGGHPEHIETYFAPLRLWGMNSIYPLKDGVAIVSRDITGRKQLEWNLTFLAEASKALSSSLDVQRTLRTVARLAVPHTADWCAVDMLTAPGVVEQLAVAHVDPKKVRWAKELRKRDPVNLEAKTGLPQVLRSGQPAFYPEITDETITAVAKDERHLELLRGIGFSSAMVVPLLLRHKAIGAITFVTAESGRHYTQADLSMAEELASRSVLAIENARLFTETQRAVALRDDFISVASHELKTPVTSLKVYTEVLQKQAELRGETQTERAVAKMNGQIDRLTVLIGDLLDASRIESGKLIVDLVQVDLDAVVAQVVEAVQVTALKHRIQIEGRLNRQVNGDADRLGQVVTNLLTNAVKYSPRADQVIVRLSDLGREAMVEVEDFGIGMDAEHLANVFDRFYRVSSPDEKTFPGLGIGLYICHEIVRRHAGRMRVASTKGEGSTFQFTLPYSEGAKQAETRGDSL